ncbi:hypothetical protein [Tabrizicola sp.]|uniref:hypothetical protein n=1 Tax=Tabrizicola sp. TaxID=2005166 RepID=UPI0035B210FE
MKIARLFLLATSVCLASGMTDAEPLWISRIMTICSVPSTEPASVVDRLLGVGLSRASLPLDDKTKYGVALVELAATWQPARLEASSPQSDWEEFRSAFNQYVESYSARLANPENTLLIDPETGALLLIIARDKPTRLTYCALGVPRSLAVASQNFPRLAFPREPEFFAVETSGAEFMATRMSLQEVVVTFDPARVGERLGQTFETGAVFSTLLSVPEWAVPGTRP